MLFQKKRLFTLVELVIVIVILVILAVIGVLSITNWIGKSKDTRRISDIKSIQNAIEIRRGEIGEYNYPNPDIPVYILTDKNGFLWSQGKIGTGMIDWIGTMKKIIKDPSGNLYEYSITSDKKYYQITAFLDNETKISKIYDEVYAANSYSYILTNFPGYIIVKEDGGKYTLVQTESIMVDPNNLTGKLSGEDYKTNLKQEIINNGTNNFTSAVTGDVTLLFDADKGNDYGVLQQLDITFSNISTPEQALDIINSASGNPNNGTVSVVTQNCTGTVYSGYTFSSLNHGQSETKQKIVSIAHGTGTISLTATCVNGSLNYGGGNTSVVCESGYVGSGSICVADLCQGTLPANAQLNGTQSVSQTWDYSETSGVCKFRCNTNYTWDGSACAANTQSASCSGSIATNATSNATSTSRTQTWNGTAWAPINQRNRNSSGGLCTFECNSSFVWSGGVCVDNTPKTCLAIKTLNPSATDGVYTIKPNSNPSFQAYCDMTNGGWTVVYNRAISAANLQYFKNTTTNSAASWSENANGLNTAFSMLTGIVNNSTQMYFKIIKQTSTYLEQGQYRFNYTGAPNHTAGGTLGLMDVWYGVGDYWFTYANSWNSCNWDCCTCPHLSINDYTVEGTVSLYPPYGTFGMTISQLGTSGLYYLKFK